MLSLSAKVRGEIGRNVHGEGVEGAVYYHQGHYYGGNGEYLYSNPGTNPPPGASHRTAPTDDTSAPSGTQPIDDLASGAPSGEREAELMQLTVTQLQKLQRAAGVLEDRVIKGEGSKAKLITWLLDNTSA